MSRTNVRKLNLRTARQLERKCRRSLYRELAPRWVGTREALRRAIRRAVRGAMLPASLMLQKVGWMLRVVREARFAALVAGAILAAGLAGPAGAAPIELSDIAAGDGGFAIDGEAAGDYSGISVSAAGDVNGDGLADLILGARYADANGPDSGRSYVIFGKASGALTQLSDIAAGTGGFAIDGESTQERSGNSVSAAGDVNGDGFSDLIVGVYRVSSPGVFSGRSYVVFGKATGTLVQLSDIVAGTGGFAIGGESLRDQSGIGVSAAGDVNGDGLADLIVGADSADPNGSRSGRSYVVFGRATGMLVELTDIAAGDGGFAIDGEAAYDISGIRVSGGGDLNGDGLADLIVGAPFADPNGESSGRSYVVFGKATGALVQLSSVAAGTGGFAISGEAANDWSGLRVSAAGDVNGDGLADLIVGAFLADPNGESSGRSYVVFGKPTGTLVQLSDIVAGSGGFVIDGEAIYDQSGISVSAAGDVNGDGLSDLIVGADLADPRGSGSGRSYIVFGKAGGASVALTDITAGVGGFAIDGEAPGDVSGTSVSSAGDVNGDGLADLIIGAAKANPNGMWSGRSYVVFSPETAAASATYKMTTVAGDGSGGDIVPKTELPPGLGDVVRVTIDYSDDDAATGGGLNGASTETITITRNDLGISNLHAISDFPSADGIFDVMWEITTDRVGFDSADVTFKYLDSELGGLSEAWTLIYTAPAPTGPWTRQPTIIDEARNEATVTVTSFGFFALGSNLHNSARQWLRYK